MKAQIREQRVYGQLPDTIDHVVMYSGGVCSWCSAKRASEKYGTQNMVLLFADTKIEDPTLYEFLFSSASNVGACLVVIADGRTPFEVFYDNKFIGNSRADLCSRILKRDLLDKWVADNCGANVTLHFGLSWDEKHRHDRMVDAKSPLKVESPMCEKPYMSKNAMLKWCRSEGLTPCVLYDQGFPHANCGGGCIKAGIKHFQHLYNTRRDVFDRWMGEEEKLREHIGKNVSILRDRRGGKAKPLTLRSLKQRIEGSDDLTEDESMDWGGCGCAVDV